MATRWRIPDDLPDLGALGYRLVPAGSDPIGVYLAPERLDDLPRGVWHGEMDRDELPAGPAAALSGTLRDWQVRMIAGIGWALREGKGPPRDSGVRPKIKILEPCTTVTLRAVGIDPEFDDITHHVLIGWARLARTGKSAVDVAWAWSREPVGPEHGEVARAAGSRAFRRNPRVLTLAEATAILARPPSEASMIEAFAPGDAALQAYAMARAVGERV